MSIRVIPAYRVVAKFAKHAGELPLDEGIATLERGLREYVRSLLSKLHPAMVELGERSAVSQLGDPEPEPLMEALRTIDDGEPCAIVEEVLARCNERLPRPDLNSRVFLFPGDRESQVLVKQLRGVLGFSLGAQATLVFLWPVNGWERWLRYTVAHEYAHLVRNLLFPRGLSGGKLVYMKTNEPETLLDAMVAEGLADAFALDLLGEEADPPWTNALSAEAERRMWPRVRRRLGASDPSEIRRILFGDNDRVPPWTGYHFGYRIVSRCLSLTPDATPASLMGHTAASMLEAGRYEPET